MEKLHKDILTVTHGIICHQVNCMGVMGAGLAAQIKYAYPQAFQDYIAAYETGELKLGDLIVTQIDDSLFIAHIASQHDYGRGAQFTNYQAMSMALGRLKDFWMAKRSEGISLPIYVPYRMGCGHGGGSWHIVKNVVDDVFPWAKICKL